MASSSRRTAALHVVAMLLAVLLGHGCKNDAPRATPEGTASSAGSLAPTATMTGSISTAAPAAQTPVASVVKGGGHVGGATSTLLHGRAQWAKKDGALEILLRENPLACGAAPKGGGDDLSFTLPAGPYGRFFEGETVGLPGSLLVDGTSHSFFAHSAMVTVDRVTTGSGGHVAGSVLVRGLPWSGDAAIDITATFDIPICPGTPSRPAEAYIDPPPPPTQKLIAAFAWLDSRHRGIEEIRLFFDGPATCASRSKANTRNFYMLVEFGRDRLGDKQASGLQPASIWYHPPAPEEFVTGGSAFPQSPAVIQWEVFDTRPGSTLRGRVWAPGSSPLVQGPFAATLCP